jgi:hypothetical protein
MICKICGTEETDNSDRIRDDRKFCIITDKKYYTEYLTTIESNPIDQGDKNSITTNLKLLV